MVAFFHDVTTLRHVKKAIEAQVDGLVLVSSGAGGHSGTLNPFAFVKKHDSILTEQFVWQERCPVVVIFTRHKFWVPIFCVHERFIASEEAAADTAYKAMVTRSGADDICFTPQFTGINANFLSQSIRDAGLDPKTVSSPRYKAPNKLLLWWKHRRLRHIKR